MAENVGREEPLPCLPTKIFTVRSKYGLYQLCYFKIIRWHLVTFLKPLRGGFEARRKPERIELWLITHTLQGR